MAARPTLTNVALSTWGQPLAGAKSKTVAVQAGVNSFANLPSIATSDVVSVSADYGIYDTTTSGNLTVEATNFKDNV